MQSISQLIEYKCIGFVAEMARMIRVHGKRVSSSAIKTL